MFGWQNALLPASAEVSSGRRPKRRYSWLEEADQPAVFRGQIAPGERCPTGLLAAPVVCGLEWMQQFCCADLC